MPAVLPAINRRELAAVFAGGCLGALARAGLVEAFATHAGRWPWVTFTVNVAGAALLGYFAKLELLRMLDNSHVGLALGYAAASLAAGFVAVAAATSITRRVRVVV